MSVCFSACDWDVNEYSAVGIGRLYRSYLYFKYLLTPLRRVAVEKAFN